MAVQCPNCGADTGSSAFCKMCGYRLDSDGAAAVLVEASPLPEPVLTTTVASTNSMTVEPPAAVQVVENEALNSIQGTSIVLADGEHVWREYVVTRLKRRDQGTGTLYVTDSRVIFLARARAGRTSRASTVIQQTKVEHVTGLSVHVSRTVNMFLAVMTTFLALALVFALLRGMWTSFIVLLLLTAGAGYLLVRGLHRRGFVTVVIHSGSSQASPIEFGEEGDSRSVGAIRSTLRTLVGPLLGLLGAPTAFDVMYGIPAEDAERVVSELGALLIDLQTKGSLAAERWGVALS
jgi:hypothetical protein